MKETRDQFQAEALFERVSGVFKQHTQGDKLKSSMTTADCLMSGLAVFSLKYPSLLSFEKSMHEQKVTEHNLKSLYKVEQIPSDSYLRQRLDGVDEKIVGYGMKSIIHVLQRSKSLERWKFLDEYYLVSLDGTRFFSSEKIHCAQCCATVHHRGTPSEQTTYHHEMLVGSIVHPDCKEVLPLVFEPIQKEDGEEKNDCERNAGKRWIEAVRQNYPKLPIVLTADGLYSNAPFILKAREARMHFICVAKDKDHKALHAYFWAAEPPEMELIEGQSAEAKKTYRLMTNVPLNDAHPDVLVNVIYYKEENIKKKTTKSWTWVTSLTPTKDNVARIVKGARARWKIENETFNTLKNQGYNFEHNYGHGYKSLSNVFAGLMLLAFLIDQCLEALNIKFQKMRHKYGAKYRLWEIIRVMFFAYYISTWEALYNAILDPPTLHL